MPIQYSPGIVIRHMWRDGSDKGTIHPADKAEDFVNTTRADLDKLKSLPTGGKLLNEIDNSGHVVQIYRTKTIDDGNCEGGDTNRQYVTDLANKTNGVTLLERVLTYASAQVGSKEYTKKKNFFQKKKVSVPLARFLNRDALAKLLGVTRSELDNMANGTAPITDDFKHRFVGHLYLFLEPGKGCDCYVEYNHKRINISDAHRRLLPMNENWEHRPPAVALGHELIHAWRVMTGRVLFPYGWEEEAMTVGLPPFSGMVFTENRLRVEYGGLAIRPDYGGIKNKTTLVTDQKLGLDDKNRWTGSRGGLNATGPAPLSSGENPTGF